VDREISLGIQNTGITPMYYRYSQSFISCYCVPRENG